VRAESRTDHRKWGGGKRYKRLEREAGRSRVKLSGSYRGEKSFRQDFGTGGLGGVGGEMVTTGGRPYQKQRKNS